MSSRPEYDDNDAFMREFERQSAMLPQPASMNTPEDMEKAERLQTLRRVSSMIRRTYHIDAPRIWKRRRDFRPSAAYLQ